MFRFRGKILSSKSIYNRALIIQSYNPQIKLNGESAAQDVLHLQKALSELSKTQEFDGGEAGTTFRFLALRLSREPGTWTLKANSRLLQRPQQELVSILQQLGVDVLLQADRWILRSQGWKVPQVLKVNTSQSSQFLSSLFLNAWNLTEDLAIGVEGSAVSEDYFKMTEKIVTYFGLQYEKKQNHWIIFKNQKPKTLNYEVEADVSSCFALAACAIAGGDITIENFPDSGLQPDSQFTHFLQSMEIPFLRADSQFSVQACSRFRPLVASLKNTPDLFPVLSVLLAQADGTSQLFDLEHLVYKESNRLQNTLQLLKKLGRKYQYHDGKVLIYGKVEPFTANDSFDPDQDHRMAMAAQLANFFGAQLHIHQRNVVDKSYPHFWRDVGVVI